MCEGEREEEEGASTRGAPPSLEPEQQKQNKSARLIYQTSIANLNGQYTTNSSSIFIYIPSIFNILFQLKILLFQYYTFYYQ